MIAAPRSAAPDNHLAGDRLSGLVVSRIESRLKRSTGLLALFQGHFWDRLLDIGVKNPDLVDSVQGVLQAVFTGLAPNTTKAYRRWWEKYCQFCARLNTKWTEAEFVEVAVFLQNLVKPRQLSCQSGNGPLANPTTRDVGIPKEFTGVDTKKQGIH